MSTGLTRTETLKLRALEKVIDEHVKAFIRVGMALREIQDLELFRGTHKTFVAYAKERWGFEKSHTYRMMDAAATQQRLSPIGEKVPEAMSLNCESHMRELKDVPDSLLEEVVERAAVIASDSGKPITAAVLREAKKAVAEPVVIDAVSTPVKGMDSEPVEAVAAEPVQAETPRTDPVADRARRQLVERLRGVRLDLGNLGLGGKFEPELQRIEAGAGI